jgi:serine/threonine-protein kinase
MVPADSQNEITSARARVGAVIKDKWRIDALLGEGGMAAVYAATHRNGSRVAIKMLHFELSRSMNVRARFRREGYVANKIAHPGAVRIHDDDVTDDGAVFLVMELLEGKTLDALWEQYAHRLPVARVLLIADGILDVLAAAHDKGILHRDIKPDNVFVTKNNEVKLLDFGIARVRENQENVAESTATGTFLGTPAFASPEQARARWELVDARTDIWALGATMFTLLTGKYVHEAETPNEQLLAAMTCPAPPLSTLRPDLPSAVVDVVDRALAFEREDRWSSALEMQKAVRAALGAIEGTTQGENASPISWRVSVTPPIAEMAITVADPSIPSMSSMTLSAVRERAAPPSWKKSLSARSAVVAAALVASVGLAVIVVPRVASARATAARAVMQSGLGAFASEIVPRDLASLVRGSMAPAPPVTPEIEPPAEILHFEQVPTAPRNPRPVGVKSYAPKRIDIYDRRR